MSSGRGVTLYSNNTSMTSSPTGRVYFQEYTDASWLSNSGTKATIKVKRDTGRFKNRLIEPKVYFEFVKTKLNEIEVKVLEKQLIFLSQNIENLKSLGQRAAFEEYSNRIATIVRQLEISSCGYSTFVERKSISLFKKIDGLKSIVYFKELSDFPRTIPPEVAEKIKEVKEKNIFDSLWVLYLDYTKEVITTNKEKIREKDPILFGCIDEKPDQFFFIIDWIDEYCDLTISSFIEKMIAETNEDPSLNIDDIIDSDYIKQIVKDVAVRRTRLKKTNSSTFRNDMETEEESYKEDVKPEQIKESLLTRFINKIKGKNK